MQTSVLRLLTCGSVDDGKSTLIGRLLVETDSVPHDTVGAARHVRRAGSTIAAGDIDFSLLTDGLEAEREQGITIDVAYRSMSLLDGRRLIISDAPGHEQYTRNMAVAASRADIAIVLIDATKGVRTQTLRHLMICNVMGVSRVIVAINKLDAVNYSHEVFSAIKDDLLSHMSRFDLPDIDFIPMSALVGDNVVAHSTNMPWYAGSSLLESIQSWQPKKSEEVTMRARVQSIVRAEDFRGVSTTIHRGKVSVGDQVRIHPSNQVATIATIVADMKKVEKADEGDAVTLVFQPEVDITRGDLIASVNEEISGSDRFSAHLVWLNEEALIHSRSYLLISGPTQIPVIVTKIRHSIDVNTGEEKPANTLVMNEIGVVEIATNAPLALLPYKESREFGNFILVDRVTSESVGAGMIRHALRRGENITYQAYEVDKSARESAKNQRAKIIWLTGLSGSGKSTIANALEKRLHALGMHSYVLDGDNLRMGLNVDLGFTAEDRAENVRRTSEVGKLMLDAGLIVITALVSPFEVDRQRARSVFNEGDFIEVFVDTPVDVCISRDPKGLYKKASEGKIPNFTGVGQDYEKPTNPEITINGEVDTQISTEQILKFIL
ncbi:bifunctional enzyme CysN/CysC [Candidatus Planktophila limnetica]|uniref:Adenylyl-sulfate kinase n=1 Tax=Candidatus Planktophila limnetica TaxID=573600 RepID=A0A249LG70_9ACTN|nr:adenylyl-sulfate kinase [Candidatus Planktophila limnetica]ASY27916.1 bifunctional enzyme CysN/CysC [Candidatus Planktophila limnetica]